VTLVANVAVVVGLGLVAYQLKGNTDEMRIRSAYDVIATQNDADNACVGDNLSEALITANLRPAEMTDGQVMQLFCWTDIMVNMTLNARIAFQAGRTSVEDWETAKLYLLPVLDYDAGRVMWSTYNQWGSMDPAFRKEIDNALAQSNGTYGRVWRPMVEGVRALGHDRSVIDAKLQRDDPRATETTSTTH